MKWTTTKLMAAVAISVLYFLISIPAYSLTVISGIPGLSGLINSLIQAIVIVLVVFIFKTAGAATLVATLYGILSLPTPSLLGPGFFPKILIAFSAGLVVDIVYALTKRNEKVAAVSTAIAFPLAIGILALLVGIAAGIPGIEKTAKLIFSFLSVPYTIAFALLGLLALKIYKKLEKTNVIQRIQRG